MHSSLTLLDTSIFALYIIGVLCLGIYASRQRNQIVFWTCMVTCVVVSLYTKPKPAGELVGLLWNKESLSLPPEQKHLQRGMRNPAIWWAIVTCLVLYFFIRYA